MKREAGGGGGGAGALVVGALGVALATVFPVALQTGPRGYCAFTKSLKPGT